MALSLLRINGSVARPGFLGCVAYAVPSTEQHQVGRNIYAKMGLQEQIRSKRDLARDSQ